MYVCLCVSRLFFFVCFVLICLHCAFSFIFVMQIYLSIQVFQSIFFSTSFCVLVLYLCYKTYFSSTPCGPNRPGFTEEKFELYENCNIYQYTSLSLMWYSCIFFIKLILHSHHIQILLCLNLAGFTGEVLSLSYMTPKLVSFFAHWILSRRRA